MRNNTCPYCNHPLVKIDRYGEVLIGCIECNRWDRPGDNNSPSKCWKTILKR